MSAAVESTTRYEARCPFTGCDFAIVTSGDYMTDLEVHVGRVHGEGRDPIWMLAVIPRSAP